MLRLAGLLLAVVVITISAHAETSRTITVAMVDSGINPVGILDGKVVESRSFTGGDCQKDLVGHGSFLARIYAATTSINIQFVCVQVLRPSEVSTPGMSGTGTLEELLAGLDYVSRLDVDIVNLSLVSYPQSSAFYDAISKLREKAVVVMAAGNDAGKVNYPCGAAYDSFRNGICITAADEEGKKLATSSFGKEADIASCCYSTSVAAANTGHLIARLMSQISPAISPRLTPALFKRLLLQGSIFDPALKGLVGDPDRGFDSRVLSQAGAIEALWRLQQLRTISYWPSNVRVGEEVEIRTNEDPQWLSGFFPAFDAAAVPKFVLDDGSTAITVNGRFNKGALSFVPPRSGTFSMQLLIEGFLVTDKMVIAVSP